MVVPLTALLWGGKLNRLENRINNIEGKINSIEKSLTEIKVNIYELSRPMVGFSNTLIDVLVIKNVITQSEATALRGLPIDVSHCQD